MLFSICEFLFLCVFSFSFSFSFLLEFIFLETLREYFKT